MTALLVLLLAADPAGVGEPLADPVVEPPPAAAEGEPEWDLGAQVSVSAFLSLEGAYLGLTLCAATPCAYNSGLPPVFGLLGAGAGVAYSLGDRAPARGWGRAVFLDSALVGAGLLTFGLTFEAVRQLPTQLAFPLLFLSDAALTAGALAITRHISPRPETVWLADSLGLWGLLLGSLATTLAPGADAILLTLGGAAAGAATGALLGVSAQRLSMRRVLLANLAAALGALVLGGGLFVYETAVGPPQRPYDPVVPAVGLAAGIAGGFLVSFALTESE